MPSFLTLLLLGEKKHLESLMIAHKQGYESHLIFLIQIENVNHLV